MVTRAPAIGLLLLTLVVDAQGFHRAGFYLLVFALAAAAVAALSAFGDLVEAASTVVRLDALLCGIGVVFVLIAAAARGQTAGADAVPGLAVSATLGALILLGPAVLLRTAPLLRRAQAR